MCTPPRISPEDGDLASRVCGSVPGLDFLWVSRPCTCAGLRRVEHLTERNRVAGIPDERLISAHDLGRSQPRKRRYSTVPGTSGWSLTASAKYPAMRMLSVTRLPSDSRVSSSRRRRHGHSSPHPAQRQLGRSGWWRLVTTFPGDRGGRRDEPGPCAAAGRGSAVHIGGSAAGGPATTSSVANGASPERPGRVVYPQWSPASDLDVCHGSASAAEGH